MTVGISDGERLWAIRYSSQHDSRTLFVSADLDAVRLLHPDNERLQQLSEGDRVVVSEPLADLTGAWLEVPESTALVVAGGAVEQRPFQPACTESRSPERTGGAAAAAQPGPELNAPARRA